MVSLFVTYFTNNNCIKFYLFYLEKDAMLWEDLDLIHQWIQTPTSLVKMAGGKSGNLKK